MAKLAGFPAETFFAMQRIRETALQNFDSLFSPGRPIWATENLRQFHALFVQRFDDGEGSFLEKWRKQLEGASDSVLQLAAELLYVQQFFTSVTGAEKKLVNVSVVLSWGENPPPAIPDWATKGVQQKIAADQSFNQHRPFHLGWLAEYLIHWHELADEIRRELLTDPWRFAADVRSIQFVKGAYQPMQEAWLCIVFPDTFENISSRKDKRRIRDGFYSLLPKGPTENVDADLLEIRRQLTAEYGEGFHFYRTPVVEQWKEASIVGHDVELFRQSRSRERYLDFSAEEKAAHKRVHEALLRLGQVALDELGGSRNYVLKRTSGFHPNSGVRGGKPKDLWFGIYRKENEEKFLGNPQIFLIVSDRGVEWGFSPLTHPDDFSNHEMRRRTREIAQSVLEQLPVANSIDADVLAGQLNESGRWQFRRKQRLDPNHSDFSSLTDWLSFLHSVDGVKNSGGSIVRYALSEEVDALDLVEEVKHMAHLFKPLIERVIAESPPTAATLQKPEKQIASPNPIRLTPFGELLKSFLHELSLVRGGPFQRTEPLWNAMSAVKTRLEDFEAVQSRPNLQVNISVGQGNWATVPWIALLNTNVTKSTQEGVYIVFLISKELDRVFLTLNQGTTNLVQELGQREAQKQMLDVASKARAVLPELASAGFVLNNEIELGGEGWLAKSYEVGTIAHIQFGTDKYLSDEEINSLLEALITAYDKAVSEEPSERFPSKDAFVETIIEAEVYRIEDALSELFLDQAELERLLTIWAVKKNIILQGAPGVGKSFIAKRLAFLLLEQKDASRIETVQFHQSYSYEDFVQGYRPDGRGGFTLRDGVFHRFCEKARLSPGRKHVFVIDEINRGNLSKILGELMLLVEPDKRGPAWATSLTYSQPDEPRFFVPKNVYLLGMMNTADRSLSMVDYALRRRFSFASLEPMFGSAKFRSLLVDNGVPETIADFISTRMIELNEAIGEDRANLGPGYRIGHSFFVPIEDFEYDSGWYRRVIETEVHPLLEEYWFDDPHKVKGWLQRLLEGHAI